jgi:hypothetical protein
MTLKPTILLLAIGLTSCRNNVDIIISNVIYNADPVDFQVVLGTDTVFNDKIKSTDIRPDLTNYVSTSLPKGKYSLKVLADSGRILIIRPVDISTDTWIFIEYAGSKAVKESQSRPDNRNYPAGFDTILIHMTREKPTFM